MASCYAALVSLQTTIRSIQNHPNPPISLDHHQAEALLKNSASLQNFLEHHSHREDFPTDDLKNKIVDAVYAAEDLIEKSTVRGSSVRHVLQLAAECGIPFDADTDEFWMKRIMEDNKHGISAAIEDMDAIIKEITEASCYAALLFLQTTIHSILNHPNPPISLDHNQSQALLRNSASLQDFLEHHSHREDYPTHELKKKIIGAASAAEDLIKKSAVLRRVAEWIPVDADIDEFWMKKIMEDYNRRISAAIKGMDAIIKEIPEDEEKHGDLQLVGSISSLSLQVSPSVGKKSASVEFDVLRKLVAMLTRGPKSSRQIIPIVGMGGIGKTTLATQAYECPIVVQHFYIRVWVTISKNSRKREFLLNILGQLFEKQSKEVFHGMNEAEMCKRIYRNLIGRRYLIIMDDIWSVDKELSRIIRHYFPREENGSRMIITTRVSHVGDQLSNTSGIQMKLLDDDQSWKLLSKIVFKEEVCPNEVDEIGKTIARGCKGLPLSIAVIGGYLAMSKRTRQHWEYVARNLSSIVNIEDNERCMKILYMSYKHLPIHLKPCFLYMSVLDEDTEIQVSWIVKLLVSEGFLKPISNKSMEVVAREYIEELADRNLISVNEWGCTGKIKSCRMHDVVRDLCRKEAQREKFLYYVGENEQNYKSESGECNSSQGDIIRRQTRIVFGRELLERKMVDEKLLDAFLTRHSSDARSLISIWDMVLPVPPSESCLLRVLNLLDKRSSMLEKNWSVLEEGLFRKERIHNYNFRYLAIGINDREKAILTSSVSLFWNLETLILNVPFGVPPPGIAIWKMPRLSHLNIIPPVRLVDPVDDNLVLWNLQTLSAVFQFKCSEAVVKKISNIRKLRVAYGGEQVASYYCLKNLQDLKKMESLSLIIHPTGVRHSIIFPLSLRKLFFDSSHHDWQDVTTMIGALPNLQKLTLLGITGKEWRSTQGQFSHLKVLKIYQCEELKSWTVDDPTHFPLLEHLTLFHLLKLDEIPSTIGDLPNLQRIDVLYCSDYSVASAKSIADEQEENGNSKLVVSVRPRQMTLVIKSWESPNFRVFTDTVDTD